MKSSDFKKTFLRLILLAWIVPPIIGLSFLVFIEMFTISQIIDILTSPLESIFIVLAVSGAYFYFKKSILVVNQHLENPTEKTLEQATLVVQSFPTQFWVTFLLYLIIAPITVIYSAQIFSDFIASPVDWFRINLVSLIVSIIVGLPIFFLILDLFGKIISQIPLSKPVVTIKVKVFLIGALVPLLIDTMLVQYYWTRTGFFNTETFIIWCVLEVLAIIGSVIFARSFNQSMQPLQMAIKEDINNNHDTRLIPQSIDELGILTSKYHELLNDLNNQHIILEKKVEERTEKLRIVNKELEAFSYSVSHDLRAPIRAISGFGEILIEDSSHKLNEEEIKNLQKIVNSAQRMQEMTEDLLKLSKINQQVLKLEKFDLSLFVLSQLELLKSTNEKRNIKWEVQQGIEINADKGLIKLAIENLLSNAWKYTQNNQETIVIFGYDENKHAYFIKDNGVGFDMKYSDKLFLPFQRLHSKNEFEGSGIGLATTNQIIEKHGGKIWANSEINVGSCFYFSI